MHPMYTQVYTTLYTTLYTPGYTPHVHRPYCQHSMYAGQRPRNSDEALGSKREKPLGERLS